MSNMLPHTPVRSVPDYLPTQADPYQDVALEGNGEEVELRQYLRILIKYRMIIGASLALWVLLALIYAFTATPLYTSSSKVRISSYEPILSATKIEDMLQEKSRENNYLETQLEEMRSYSLADRVLEDPDVKQAFEKRSRGVFSTLFWGAGSNEQIDASRSPMYKSTLAEIRRYLDTIKITPVRRTSIVVIEATAKDPASSALLANRHAESYILWVRSTRVEQQSQGLKYLRQQADELREKVAGLERELAEYAEANSIVALNKDENITVQRMSQLSQLLTQATARRIEAENIAKEAENSLKSPSAGFEDNSTQTLRSELAKLEGEYGELGAKFTPSYPKMQQLRSQIEELKRAIQGQRRQIVIGLQAKATAAAEEEKNLREELEQQKSQAFELSKRQVQYNVLNREATSSRELLQNVLRQIKETSLSVESNASNVSIVDHAIIPAFPSWPRKSAVLLIGLLLGGAIGVGIAFLLNYLDNTVKTPEEVHAALGIPALGVVPSFGIEPLSPQKKAPAITNLLEGSNQSPRAEAPLPAIETDPNALPILFINEPKSLASEAYRTIRTGILLSRAGEPPRTILVSSAQSSEGKTTSCVNLAASLASSGGRVILLDADLRRPSVHKHFKLQTVHPGLVEVLTGQCSIKDVGHEGLLPRVTVVLSGRIPPNPAELLGSLEMARLIDQLSAEYDYVLIDSPPVLPVTDSVILSRYVDGVVLVIRGAATPRKVAIDAKNRLKAVGAHFLGAILNDVDITGGDYYYYNRYYYSYYTEEKRSSNSGA